MEDTSNVKSTNEKGQGTIFIILGVILTPEYFLGTMLSDKIFPMFGRVAMMVTGVLMIVLGFLLNSKQSEKLQSDIQFFRIAMKTTLFPAIFVNSAFLVIYIAGHCFAK